MPFVLDTEDWWQRPAKRRKVSPSLDMARTNPWEASPPSKDEDKESHAPAEPDTPTPKLLSRQETRTSDRDELIQCIKRGERPTWVPNPNLEALRAEADAQAVGILEPDPSLSFNQESKVPSVTSTSQLHVPTPPRDPVERPPSALHSGDFHQPFPGHAHQQQSIGHSSSLNAALLDLPPASPPPWMLDSSPRFQRMPSDPTILTHSAAAAAQRPRAPSLGSSLSSSFVMRAPTSPLVNATSSPGLDAVDHEAEPRGTRRRTLPPRSFASVDFSTANLATSTPVPALRREATTPYRTHQARRSLTSFTYQPAPSAQVVFPSRQRRFSQATEVSPRARQSMVGSFEESILRGRMSTPPSKPLDFVAQIGVLGKGKCPPNLKCPAHVSVPFPAVYYNYASATGVRSIADDSPSPYVGTVDLEQHLKPVEEAVRHRQKADSNDPDAFMAQITGPEYTSVGRALARQDPQEHPKILLDGAYRVPQQGQLQVIIKNPNKTAVKLFLIPYSLEGMGPGQKTFVRQRSFSSGPIVENVMSDKPIHDPLSNKHMLRYLIHLKFCCLSKGRYYLYDSIRVVFANRVPEGKEKLRNEIQLPEPTYSPFVAGSTSRRPSIAATLSPSQLESIDVIEGQSMRTRQSTRFFSDPIPFHSGRSLPPPDEQEVSQMVSEIGFSNISQNQEAAPKSNEWLMARPKSPEVHGFDRISTSQRGSPVPWNSGMELADRRSPSPALSHGDGLLSRKLRELSGRNGQMQRTNASEKNAE